MVYHLLILSTILFLSGCSFDPRTKELVQLDNANEKKAWVYLCGLTKEWNSPQEINNRKILRRIADAEKVKIIAIQPTHRCVEFDNKLCWPHGTKNQVQTTYKEIIQKISSEKIAGFIGFSNGGFFLNKLSQEINLNKPVISIGSGGFLISAPFANKIYLIIGRKDAHHYFNALSYYKQVKNHGNLTIDLIEHHNGHIIPEIILRKLIHKLKNKSEDRVYASKTTK